MVKDLSNTSLQVGEKGLEIQFLNDKNYNGIDSEIQSRLFSKFTTKSDIGTGLGLFIAKSIMEVHGGKISAENNKDGGGATITFSLPLD